MSVKLLGACVFVVAASACATHTPPPSTTPDGAAATQQPAANHNRDIITQAELQAPGIPGLSVLEAIQSLRPQYLVVRGQHELPAGQVSDGANGTKQINDNESGKVHVSIDGGRIGPLDDLSNIRAGTVREIRYMNAVAAHQKFGGAAREGPVIYIVVM
jgi:hypothetical protein